MVCIPAQPTRHRYTADLIGETPLVGTAEAVILRTGTLDLRLMFDTGRKLRSGQRGQRAFRRLVARGVLSQHEAGRLFGLFLCKVCRAEMGGTDE